MILSGFLRKIIVFSMVLFVSSCGSTQGVIEFQQYTLAFDLQFEAGNTVLDSVARAERIVGLRRINRRQGIPDFRPKEAAYWVDTVQPPITASFRSSLKILKSYNDALGALANGEAADALAARLGKLVTDVSGTGVAFASATNNPATSKIAGKLIGDMVPYIGIFKAAFKVVAVRQGREQFRVLLIDEAGNMEKFIVKLRQSTSVMFQMMESSRAQGDFQSVSPAGRKELERERVLLAGWVLLMDKTLIAMRAAVAVASAKHSSLQTASAVSEAAIELRIVAEQIRSLRSKP